MILLINKPLEYSLKLAGLWPSGIHLIGVSIVVSAILTLIPFQFRLTFFMNAGFELVMDSLSHLIPELVIMLKLFILWKNRR